jgi:predicted ATPase
VQLTSFVGRSELKALGVQCRTRLLTLTGVGGVSKTRLAISCG